MVKTPFHRLRVPLALHSAVRGTPFGMRYTMDETGEILRRAGADHIGLTADVVAAYLSNNHVQVAELPALLANVHAAITRLGQSAPAAEPEIDRPTPGQIRRSIRPDALISFEDRKPYKTLKRHLTKLGLSADEYRAKWGLPRDYPMITASYSEQRSKLALSLGFGQRNRKAAPKLALVAETAAGPAEYDDAVSPSAKPTTRRKPRIATTK